MSNLKTAYGWGYAFAEWCSREQTDYLVPVDYDAKYPEIPSDDAHQMEIAGVDLDARSYWAGFNAMIETMEPEPVGIV